MATAPGSAVRPEKEEEENLGSVLLTRRLRILFICFSVYAILFCVLPLWRYRTDPFVREDGVRTTAHVDSIELRQGEPYVTLSYEFRGQHLVKQFSKANVDLKTGQTLDLYVIPENPTAVALDPAKHKPSLPAIIGPAGFMVALACGCYIAYRKVRSSEIIAQAA